MTLVNCRNSAATINRHSVWGGQTKPFMAVAMAALAACLTSAPSFAETRSLKLYHLHTREKAEIVYKRNGRYDKAGLKKINHILRDWRRNEPIQMDPRLLDLVWQAYRQSGSNAHIQIISGYRAPATNSMLRSRTKGVAKKSQHMLGKAMDFYIPGVPLKKLRDIGLTMQGGGVGYYPTSGSPFVHMDVGNVRHWPGISRQELARVFPNGKTLHVPSDGKPLPGYQQALSAYQARKTSGTPNIEMASAGASKSGGLLAALFGGGADEAEDVADSATIATSRAKTTNPPARRNVDPPKIAIVAPEDAQRAVIAMAAPDNAVQAPSPQTVVAALAPEQIPVPMFAERPVIAKVAIADLSIIPLPNWRPAEAQQPAPAPEQLRETLVASIAPETETPARRRSSARTSPKAGRATAGSKQVKPALAALPAEWHARYWPHRLELGISEIVNDAPVPQMAANFIRTAPAIVYIGRFQPDRRQHDSRRFSGSAVNFLPLARFDGA